MYAPPLVPAHDAGIQDRLLAVFGRDPSWRPGILSTTCHLFPGRAGSPEQVIFGRPLR